MLRAESRVQGTGTGYEVPVPQRYPRVLALEPRAPRIRSPGPPDVRTPGCPDRTTPDYRAHSHSSAAGSVCCFTAPSQWPAFRANTNWYGTPSRPAPAPCARWPATQSCMSSRIDVGVEQVAVADLHPDAQRLARGCRDQRLVKLPRAARRLGVRAATAGSRTCRSSDSTRRYRSGRYHAMISAHDAPELHPIVARPSGSFVSFTLHFFSTSGSTSVSTNSAYRPRHRVVLEPALAALRVAAAVADRDRDHRRHALLRDQVVERREQQSCPARRRRR